MRIFWISMLMVTNCVQSMAQQDAPRAYEAIRSSVSYRNAVVSVYQSYESALATHCAKIDLNMNTSEARVLTPFQTDAQGNIVNGHWKEATDGVACGEKRLYNASITIRDGKPQVLALFPGHSYASPLLQHDAVPFAAIGAGADQGCVADVVSTELPNGEPSESHVPWVERWTVHACGKRATVTMHFIPDATGTTINVSPKETVALP